MGRHHPRGRGCRQEPHSANTERVRAVGGVDRRGRWVRQELQPLRRAARTLAANLGRWQRWDSGVAWRTHGIRHDGTRRRPARARRRHRTQSHNVDAPIGDRGEAAVGNLLGWRCDVDDRVRRDVPEGAVAHDHLRAGGRRIRCSARIARIRSRVGDLGATEGRRVLGLGRFGPSVRQKGPGPPNSYRRRSLRHAGALVGPAAARVPPIGV